VALEMLAARPDLDTLLVPVGGGGLIAGIAVAARAIKPTIEIVGVQSEQFPSMYAAFKGETRRCAQATIAEGIAVGEPGRLTRAIVRQAVDDIVLVSEGDIEHAILLLLEIEKTVVEGAGAAALAALIAHAPRFAGRRIGVVLSGGNIEPMMLADIIERGMVRAGRLVRLRVATRDVPGELARVATIVGNAGANIEDIEHQRAFTTLPAQNAQLQLVLQTRGPQHVQELLQALHAAGLTAEIDSYR
ncbi:MAG: pyridoxal-phosphate dependent enzyme, partial [Burkholderiaceae bacterium]|nr:pyridoxal-phosphate dependent enzyme [Burkholderiaceae bacterium]